MRRASTSPCSRRRCSIAWSTPTSSTARSTPPARTTPRSAWCCAAERSGCDLGDEGVRRAAGDQWLAAEIERALEEAGDEEPAGGVGGDPHAGLVSRVAGGEAPHVA